MQQAAPPRRSQRWSLHKPAAHGRRGMVVAQAAEAAEAGIAVLDAGGNAIDAAVAAALALAAVEPWNSGLGGVGFAVVHRAGAARAEVVDFGPVAPRGLDPARFPLTGTRAQDLFGWPQVAGDANIHGPLSCVIPSAAAGYALMHACWGRMGLAEVMAPSVALARRGVAQDWFCALKIANAAPLLRAYSESAPIYLQDGLPRLPPYQGSPGYFPLGRLTETLEWLQHAGLEDLYRGEVAASIAADLAAMGGVLSAEDLRHCRARVVAPMDLPWRGGALQLAGGLTAAPTLARVLAKLADPPGGAAPRGATPGGATPDAAWFAALAAALKSAYAERLAGLGAGEPAAAEGCTTHLSVCDEDGTMVALTSTLLSSMGSRMVLPGSGILMNNGVMWFDPRPGRPNSIAPGARPLTNMCPVILRDGDRPVLAAGASGGRRILASVVQMLEFVQGFGMDPETAAHHPRIDVSDPDMVHADLRLEEDVLAALRGGGAMEVVEHGVLPINFACPNLILRSVDGVVQGVADVQSPWSAAVAQD